MINILKDSVNTIALTLTEKVDLAQVPYNYLFEFQNKMTLETLFFTASDTSLIPNRINIFNVGEGGTYSLSMQEGSWVYNVYQVTPGATNSDNYLKWLEDGRVWVIPNPCPVPGWGIIPVVPDYITDCGNTPSVVESITIDEPIVTCYQQTGWNIVIDGTVVQGSGSYSVQVEVLPGTWSTVDSFNAPTTGTGSWNVNVDNLGQSLPITIPVRFIDSNTLVISNEETIILEQCTFLSFKNTTSIRCSGSDVYLNVVGAANNQSGNYLIQGYIASIWTALNNTSWFETGDGAFTQSINLSDTTTIDIATFAGQNMQFRIYDSVLFTNSGSLTLSVPSCGSPELPEITILQATSSCSGVEQSESVQIEINYDGLGHSFNFEYYDGFNWTTIGTTIGGMQSQFYVQAMNTNITLGSYQIRVTDSTDGITSGQQVLEFVDCTSTTIVFNYLDVFYTFFNTTAFDVYSPLSIEESIDDINWTSTGGHTLATPGGASPWTGTDSLSWAAGTFPGPISGRYYRIKGYDVGLNGVYSNSLLYT